MTARPNLPAVVFPYGIDDYRSLCQVHNVSESKLASQLTVDNDSFQIVPRFDLPELWSPWGGWVHIDDEDLYYAEGIYSYESPLIPSHLDGPITSSSALVVELPSPMAIASLPASSVPSSTAVVRGGIYTIAGTISIGGVIVDFSVMGDGYHGAGAVFSFQRPELVERSLCMVDADHGSLFIATKAYSWKLVSASWMQAPIDSSGAIGKRVTHFRGLVRGCNSTDPAQHEIGATARGYIRAEHYRLLAEAMEQIETLTGIDMSEDRASIDFRLRDLTDLCIEKDDVECVEISLTQQQIEEPCDPNAWMFDVALSGGQVGSYTLNFGDGASSTETDGVIHSYPPGARVEPTVVVGNDVCVTSTARFISEISEPEAIPPTDVIVCPPITIPDIIVSPDFFIPEFPTIPDITFPDISIPSSIDIPQVTFPTITFPQITFPTITFPPINFTFYYTISVVGPEGTGPCFQLVPCDAGYCHGL